MTGHALRSLDPLAPVDTFVHRHIGPREDDVAAMLAELGYGSLSELSDAVIPEKVRTRRPLEFTGPAGGSQARGEHELLAELRGIMTKNQVFRSYIGLGYHGTVTPPVVQRNVFENPGWYTQYTPYQAEISQGRLEAMLNFQTLVADLTGLPVANASLLDEGTAAAEAMSICLGVAKGKKQGFFVAQDCHPQTIAVVRTRALPLGVSVHVGDPSDTDFSGLDLCGALLSYPTTDGRIEEYRQVVEAIHDAGALAVVATDLLALTLLTPPGEWGADIAVGSAQRFGVPMGYGGPHAAFMAVSEGHQRQIPGRIVGVSKDAHGRPAFRLALQTREQHIRREKATSNICTAQVLLAVMASMYAVYHGPEGLVRIARRVHAATRVLAAALGRLGHDVGDKPYFDTLKVRLGGGLTADDVHRTAAERQINLRRYEDGTVGVSLDETVRRRDLADLFEVFAGGEPVGATPDELAAEVDLELPAGLARTSAFLTHEVFHQNRAEHEMLRYLKKLEERDLSLAHSMIPLGSCTMKLNATSEMLPVTWPEVAHLHPFAPAEQAIGYHEMMAQLDDWLSEITGFARVSLQPNAGSQGEYAGLLVIRAYHASRGEAHRDVCLIPKSAHGTNPASAVMAGLQVVPVATDENGNVDLADLEAKAEAHQDRLAALMITYPSTHGVFERDVKTLCQIVHDRGGQVYMDGANMNAQVGLCRPGEMGMDVCHLNLHKTFCIPHGGGGPGVGPIGVAEHLVPFLPGHPLEPEVGGEQAIGPIAAAPFGSASILPISWVYIALMGAAGLTRASQVAILAANYMAHRLRGHYDVLYTGNRGLVAHEFILDARPFRDGAGVTVDDIAKRLMDYGFHAPTMSWPVAGTLMVEPTESESRPELDRLCDALIAIREEIRAVEEGRADREDNVLKNAPHTARDVSADDWQRPYGREQAAYPAPWVRERKFWPPVSRIDNAYGDRHLVCVCPPMEEYEQEPELVAASVSSGRP